MVEDAIDPIPSSGNLLETKASQLDDLLSDKLEKAFHRPTSQFHLHDVAKIACEHSPIDLAYAAPRLPPHARIVLYENLPDIISQSDFIIETDSSTRTYIFRHLEESEITKLVEKMPLDEAVWVLEDLSDRRLRIVLDSLDPNKVTSIHELMKHDRNSAGRLMTNEFFSFTSNTTIKEAATYIRDHPGVELTRWIFVVNQIGELQGYVPARNIIINSPDMPLKKVMRAILHKVDVDTHREEVIDIVERYKISALPVISKNNFLEGVITYEDVLEAMEDITDEAFAHVAGTGENASIHDSVAKRFVSRFPWLVVTLLAGLINMRNMSFFSHIEGSWFVTVFFFVPLVTGMSGSVGLQCSTVLVRGMATGVLSLGGKNKVLIKELSSGLLTGLIFGVFSGLIVYVLDQLGLQDVGVNPITVGLIVGLGLLGTCLLSTTMGIFFPLLFAKIRVDPAIASGPIVTAFNDVLSTLIFFLIASMVSSIDILSGL